MMNIQTRGLRRVLLAALVLMTALAAPALADSDGTVTYRALLVGNSSYANLPNLPSCAYDAANMRDALRSGSIGYGTILVRENQSAVGIQAAVNGMLSWGADDDDVTVFYYSGHGASSGLAGVNYNGGSDIYSFSLLQSTLSNVRGTVIILLDACESGGLINKRAAASGSFAENAVAAFSEAGSGLAAKAITSGAKFHVIASSSQTEDSYASSGSGASYGLATNYLCEAMGWQHSGAAAGGNRLSKLEGDANGDGTVTVGEAYAHAAAEVARSLKGTKYQQNMQIYPEGSVQTLVRREASDPDEGEVAKSPVTTMNLAKACIAPGMTLQLDSGLTGSVGWSSSKNAIATVSTTGLVTGVRASSSTPAVIMAQSGTSYTTCQVRVLSARYVVQKLRFKTYTLTLEQGKSYTMPTRFSPASAKYKNLRWKSSDLSVATVSSSGRITAVGKSGTATITATATSGVTAECVVTATGALPRSVKLDAKKLTLIPGQKVFLAETISPANAENKSVTWTSSKPKVATVNADGQVTAVATGKTTITVRTANGKKATCAVNVVKNQSVPRSRAKSASGKLVNSARRIYYTATGSMRVDLYFYNRTRYTQTVPQTDRGLIVLRLKNGTKIYDTVDFLTRKQVRSGRCITYTVELNLEDYPKFAGLNLLGSDAWYEAVN